MYYVTLEIFAHIVNKEGEDNILMNEIWKDIEGYEGIYQVSNLGRVKSLSRIIIDKNGHNKTINEHYMTGSNNGHGYLTVMFHKDGKGIRRYIHRLVAQAFISNPNNLPEVNHKDENRENNIVTNLEWVNYLTNRTYGTRLERLSDSNTEHAPIIQYDLDFNYVAKYKNAKQATDILGYDDHGTGIYKCANKKSNTAHGYIWRYEDDLDIYYIPIPTKVFKDIYQYNATTGEYIKHYYTYTTASEEMKICSIKLRKYIDTNKVIHNYFWTSTPLDSEHIKQRIDDIQNSSVKGVIKDGNKWYSQIGFNKKHIQLGGYLNKEDAIKARLQKELELYGAFNAPQSHLFYKYLNIYP